MAEPRTTYQSPYPSDKFQGNVQQERTESGRLVSNARDYNIHDVEIRALQCFLGLATTIGGFSPSGPKPGTGDTIVDRLRRIAGTASCWEDGTICDYSGPDGIDPGATNYIATTATYLGEDWIDPTALPPTPPPFPLDPLPPGVPWPGPGGGSFQYTPPAFPGAPWVPPPPVGPAAPTLPFQWFAKFGIQYWQYVQAENAYRWAAQSAETINFWPRPLSDLWEWITDLISLGDNWPVGRVPSATDRASIFDVLLGNSIVSQLVRRAFGIAVYPGTISGTVITFDTGTDVLDSGAPGATVGDTILVLSTLNNSTYERANLIDLQNAATTSILGTGPVAGAAGPFRIIGSSAFTSPVLTDVLVVTFKGAPLKTTQGDENTIRNEQILGGPTFVTTDTITDGKGGRPIANVLVRTAPGGPWIFLNFSGGVSATDANNYGYTAGTKTIDTFAPAGYIEVQVQYMCTRP